MVDNRQKHILLFYKFYFLNVKIRNGSNWLTDIEINIAFVLKNKRRSGVVEHALVCSRSLVVVAVFRTNCFVRF